MKPYVAKIHVPMYDWDVYFYTNKKRALPHIERVGFASKSLDAWHKTNGGISSIDAESHDAFVGIFSGPIGTTRHADTLAHECVHVAMAVLARAGVLIEPENHEALAYLVGFLVNEYLTSAKKRK